MKSKKFAETLKINKDVEIMGLKFSEIEAKIPLDASEIRAKLNVPTG